MNATGELETFRAHVSELDDAESGRVRGAFIETFLNQADPLFVDYIETLRSFSDGPAYTGYLWDFLRSPTVVDERELWTRIFQVGELFVMWDVHSSELIRIPDYWKFPKAAVLSSSGEVAFKGQSFLPEDLYLFDMSFRWTGVLTHEFVDGRRYCLWQEGLRRGAPERTWGLAAQQR
jgi:hypothetical protein